MSLTPGTRLGPYEIIAPIGAGGMGEALSEIIAAGAKAPALHLQDALPTACASVPHSARSGRATGLNKWPRPVYAAGFTHC